MKAPRVNKSIIILLLAVLIGGGAAFAINHYLKRQVEAIRAKDANRVLVRVVVATEDLAKGVALSAKNVAAREVPKEWLHSNAIRESQFDKADGQVLAHPALRGEPIVWAQLEGEKAPSFSTRLVPGRRAITVPVDEINSISGMLVPGDRIDLMVTIKKDRQTLMLPLLQSVQVMATGTRASSEDPEGKRAFTTVTLDATPDEARRVLAAREVGKLAALLRAPGDQLAAPSRWSNADAVLGLPVARSPVESSVPVIYGGGEIKAPARLGGAPSVLPSLKPE